MGAITMLNAREAQQKRFFRLRDIFCLKRMRTIYSVISLIVCSRVAYILQCSQKLSMGALSKQLPLLLMEGRILCPTMP